MNCDLAICNTRFTHSQTSVGKGETITGITGSEIKILYSSDTFSDIDISNCIDVTNA